MRTWDRLVEEYMEQCSARGLAVGTMEKIRRELDRLGCWLKKRRPRVELEAIQSEMLIEYLRGRGAYRAKVTLAGCVSVMRGWGDFLVHRGTWRENPLRWIKGPKVRMYDRVPRRISGTALQDLWEEAAKGRQKYYRYLWLAVLSLLYGTGLRRGELSRLDVAAWNREDGTLRIDGRKTGQERQVAVPELTFRCVETYLSFRQNHLESLGQGTTSEPALLVDAHGGRLSMYAISSGIKRLGRRAGLEKLTLHQFRHSCASDLLEKGVHLPEVQRLLGHQCIATTVRYLHIADPQRHQAVSLHPINQILAAVPLGEAISVSLGGQQ